jgi:hypothetical protein
MFSTGSAAAPARTSTSPRSSTTWRSRSKGGGETARKPVDVRIWILCCVFFWKNPPLPLFIHWQLWLLSLSVSSVPILPVLCSLPFLWKESSKLWNCFWYHSTSLEFLNKDYFLIIKRRLYILNLLWGCILQATKWKYTGPEPIFWRV